MLRSCLRPYAAAPVRLFRDVLIKQHGDPRRDPDRDSVGAATCPLWRTKAVRLADRMAVSENPAKNRQMIDGAPVLARVSPEETAFLLADIHIIILADLRGRKYGAPSWKSLLLVITQENEDNTYMNLNYCSDFWRQ